MTKLQPLVNLFICYLQSSAPPELSEEEKKAILMSEDFHKFFDRTSRIMERALFEEDFYVDYTGKDSSGKDE